ncbi:MAG: S8 family serine peptidase [Proteobacteria bacterium]|jgi:subtilisin family serine protease|nr:S8 family serine peptidase [Pseudomonadota bacterium]
MKKSSQITKLLIVVGLAVTAGCTPSSRTQEFLGGEGAGLFGNRPQNRTHFIAVVKLGGQPLLESAKRVNGQLQIAPEELAKLEIEQKDALVKLKDLSSEIRVLYTYKMVLNGFAIVAPIELADKIRALVNVAYVESEGNFSRPKTVATLGQGFKLTEKNSVNFIGADAFHTAGFKGQGMKVGIIDTGIDFTHSMFQGPGTEDAFKEVNPDQETPFFPNKKVVGGIDLVGTQFDAGSPNFVNRVPQPDLNPIDEGGHGTHVAGTVAGIGDDVETYSGVAPEALLYAIKVFGADGSTGDGTVIAALEYAADPNKDGKLDDQLDVVNLSLGSSFGAPHILYGEAMGRLSRAGTAVIAAAGNSGDTPYIVGSPSVAEDALSVAAGIDHTSHNWQFDAVELNLGTQGSVLVEAVEGPISQPVRDAGAVTGALVDIGLADVDLSEAQRTALKGQVALIARGKVAFADKLKRAFEAGAVGAIVTNNAPGDAFAMGGNGQFPIPAIMVTQAIGDQVRLKMQTETVSVNFQSSEKIERPALIDTITGFSSRGPRSLDALIKPEITAPGSQIISAAMGGGHKGVKLSGTSMATPHMAGVMALLMQKEKNSSKSISDLKSLLMTTSHPITDADQKIYPIARQGAGRVDMKALLNTAVLAQPSSLSLGVHYMQGKKVLGREILITNLTGAELSLKAQWRGSSALTLSSQDVKIAPQSKQVLSLKLTLDAGKLKSVNQEVDGWVEIFEGAEVVARLPVLALVNQASDLLAQSLTVFASSELDGEGALSELKVQNSSNFAGDVLAFNLLGKDSRKLDPKNDPFMSRACDLESAGYRIVEKTIDGRKASVLQFAAKTFEPNTNWHACELTVQIDTNGDELSDQEIAFLTMGSVAGLAGPANSNSFVSALVNSAKMRELRRDYEAQLAAGASAEEDYTEAVISVIPAKIFENSGIAVVEADVSKIQRRPSGELAVKVSTTHYESSAVEPDDYLDDTKSDWKKLSLKDQSFMGMEEILSVKPQQSAVLMMTKGAAKEDLLLLFPQNTSRRSVVGQDQQSQVIKAQTLIP